MSELETYDEWIREVIGHYRDLGFFQAGRFHGSSVDDAVRLVEEAWASQANKRRGNGTSLTWNQSERDRMWQWCGSVSSRIDRDVEVLKTDPSRCWAFDQESVYGDARFYEEALLRLGEISRGVFRPARVREAWHDADEFQKRIELDFEVEGVTHRFWIPGHGDFMNMGIIAGVNAIIAGESYRFVVHGADQDKVIFCLHANEESRLLERGWRFEPIPPRCPMLQWPDVRMDEKHEPELRDLLFLRGATRFRTGDRTGAWLDWNEAIGLGEYDVIPPSIRSLMKQAD